ncbi:MAG: phosphohydrolase, partial [Eubacteriales bacterium]
MTNITLADIKTNRKIETMIHHSNRCLEAIGYTDHGPRHVGYVSKIAGSILEQLGFDERRVELAKIAGWVHDVGNMVNRKHHGMMSSVLL